MPFGGSCLPKTLCEDLLLLDHDLQEHGQSAGQQALKGMFVGTADHGVPWSSRTTSRDNINLK